MVTTSSHLAVVVLSAIAALGFQASGAEARHPAWETCSLTEGKGDDCSVGDRPRPFKEYLVPGEWAERSHSQWFSPEFVWDLKNLSAGHWSVKWREIGSFGLHRIRNVTYLDGTSVFADLLLVESS